MADFTVSTIDRQSLRTSMRIGILDASTTPQLQAVVDAIDGVIRGADASGTKTVPTEVDAGSAVPPADEEANRGNKWLLRFQDSTNGKIFTHEIGTADNSLLATPSDDYLDLTAGAGLALKTALDAVYQSPYSNAGVLISVQQVNRGE